MFVNLVRCISIKLLKSCSESQKLLKVAKIEKKLLKTSKIAEKLPSTICSRLLAVYEL